MMNLLARKKVRRAAARFAPKWLRSPLYKSLYRALRSEFTLSAAGFSGKRVLIIGPAVTGPAELSDMAVERFDVVVKMNNGIFTSNPLFENKNRCDILFHSLTDDTKPVSLRQIEICGVETIVHRVPTRSAFLRTLGEEGRYESVAEMKIIPYEDYKTLSESLDGYSPSTGMTCVDFFLKSKAAEVAIVGFTFFSTRYVSGYDDSVETDEASKIRVEMADHHSPKHEARLMKDIIAQARQRGISVVIGPSMQEAMHEVGK